jgi:outer membrane protein OmpA-like peptidoglycan-associated protein
MKTTLITICLVITIFNFAQTSAPIKVNVTDYNKKVLEGEQVLFVNQVSQKTYKGISDSKGFFQLSLPIGKYDIKLKSIGHSQDYSTLEIPKIGANQTYSEMELQIMINAPMFFTLNNLHFASARASILKSSYSELNELVQYLKLKPSINIEISGHTDSDGDEKANMELSLKRANAVKQYLTNNGISSSRITIKGYGETRPITNNMSEQGKAKNRRTEVRVI